MAHAGRREEAGAPCPCVLWLHEALLRVQSERPQGAVSVARPLRTAVRRPCGVDFTSLFSIVLCCQVFVITRAFVQSPTLALIHLVSSHSMCHAKSTAEAESRRRTGGEASCTCTTHTEECTGTSSLSPSVYLVLLDLAQSRTFPRRLSFALPPLAPSERGPLAAGPRQCIFQVTASKPLNILSIE
jgi:hypothetical protein